MILEIKNASLIIPGSDKLILSNINYQINKNDFVIILGSNGSGKSSLMKLMDRRFTPTSGDILLNDTSIKNIPLKELHNRVITLTQNCHDSLFISLTVLENCLLTLQRKKANLLTIRNKKERKFFADYLQEFNPNLSFKLDQSVDKLSGGEKQALALALSVLYPPDILLLDEHTSALDPKSAQHLMELTHRIVKNHKITCILTTHDLNIATYYGNRILSLRQGEIFQTIENDKKLKTSQEELLRECY